MRLFDTVSMGLLAVFAIGLVALLTGVTVYLRKRRREDSKAE